MVTLHNVSFTGTASDVYNFGTVHTTAANASIFNQSKEQSTSTEPDAKSKYNIGVCFGSIGNGATIHNMTINTFSNDAAVHKINFVSNYNM